MPIYERLMKPGTFDIDLIPETPKAIRDIVQPFGHILVYEAPLDPRIVSDGDLLTNSLYCGVLRRKPAPLTLSGAHITLWTGDEENKGPIISPNLVTNSFVQWVTAALNTVPQPVVAGTLTATGGNLTQTFTRQTSRQILDWLMQYYSAEYRVRTDAANKVVLDAGPSASIYATTPTMIVMPREGGRELGGLVGVEPSIFQPVLDADSYSTDILLVGGAGTGTAAQGSVPYKDLRGNQLKLTRVVSSPQTAAGQENTIAASQLALYPVRNELKLSSDRYDIPHDVKVGDWLNVYDPEHDLIDTTNPKNYRGQIVWPLKLRLFALTWPVEPGMSVYYRDLNGVYTDLTTFVVYEKPGTTFEVGLAPVRGLTVF